MVSRNRMPKGGGGGEREGVRLLTSKVSDGLEWECGRWALDASARPWSSATEEVQKKNYHQTPFDSAVRGVSAACGAAS